jgi:hypothetical protein
MKILIYHSTVRNRAFDIYTAVLFHFVIIPKLVARLRAVLKTARGAISFSATCQAMEPVGTRRPRNEWI